MRFPHDPGASKACALMTGLSLRSSGQPRKPLRAKSKKRAAQEPIFNRLRAEYLAEHPWCERCGAKVEHLHHAAGRQGENYLDVSTFRALCFPCHAWAHANPTAAKEAGFILLRNGVRVIK